MPSTDVIFLSDEDKPVPIGQVGEICVRGPQVMSGYWNHPDTNETSFTGDGFFRTGDIGVFDDYGYLKIVDRKKDMVLVSGFSVYPNEIEACVVELDGVAECAAIGVPDEKTGEAVRLFVVQASGSALNDEGIIAHCRAALAGYKVPRQVKFLESLPKSTVGKILRKDLLDI